MLTGFFMRERLIVIRVAENPQNYSQLNKTQLDPTCDNRNSFAIPCIKPAVVFNPT